MKTPSIRTLVLSSLVGVLVGTLQPSPAAEPLVGGFSGASVTNAEVIAAAQFAVKTQAESKWPLIGLVEILGAQQQVVAGINYRLRLKVKVNSKNSEVDTVVWRKLSGEHELTSWSWLQVVQMQVRPVQFNPEEKQREVYIGADTNAISTVEELHARIKGLPVGTELQWYSGCFHYKFVPVGTNRIPMKEFVNLCEKAGVTFSYSCGF